MKKIGCPTCQTEINLQEQKANPRTCGGCGAESNVVTLSLPFGLRGLGGKFYEEMEKLFQGFAQAGENFMQAFTRRFREFSIFPKQKGICTGCGEEKNLTMEKRKTGEKFCSACGREIIFGSEARKEILPQAKDESPIPRRTVVDLAFTAAQQMFSAWLSNNWVEILRRNELEREFARCKGKGKGEEPKDENWEIRKIREEWRGIRAPMSPLNFFDTYWSGRRINTKNRNKRRARLKELGNKTEVALMVAQPICEGCERLKQYEWGYECGLDKARAKSERPDKVPSFFTTKVKLPKSSYRFSRNEDGTYTIELALWGKEWQTAELHGDEWVREYYDEDLVFSDNTRYPDILRRVKGKKIKYFFIYPFTQIVPVNPGEWQHVISYTPETTCIVSNLNGQRKVRFFRHPEIPEIKGYYSLQREEARRGYFERERLKESRTIKLRLHEETRQIADYVMVMPGTVVLLNFKKELYRREEAERRELNQRLRLWNDSIFRGLMGYKLELRGFTVKEQEFDATDLAACPYCGSEIGGSWQDAVVEEKKSLSCRCGKDTNTNLAMALTV